VTTADLRRLQLAATQARAVRDYYTVRERAVSGDLAVIRQRLGEAEEALAEAERELDAARVPGLRAVS